jgi:hypothetical protein
MGCEAPSSPRVLLLSTLIACFHLGLRPSDALFGEVNVSAPVAEPGIDEALRGALLRSLAARDAVGDGPTLEIVVVEAALTPTVRSDAGGLWYVARLQARASVSGHERMFSVQDWVAETGSVPDRAHVFVGLAEALSAQVAAWATSAASAQSKPAQTP